MGENGGLQTRLAAFVVRSDRKIAMVDLGPAFPVALAVEVWRITNLPLEIFGHEPEVLKNIGDRWQATVGANVQPGDKLREWVWDQLRPHLDGCNTVLISPDGATARFPWSALPGQSPGSFLLEEVALAQIPVAQMLPELLASRAPAMFVKASSQEI
jgi:hypothetical protein